jgi:outer membrane lipoprotein-sorting protein
VSGRRQLRSRLVLLLLVLLLGGCVKALAPPRQPLSPEAQRLIELLVARWRDFADLRTLADIHVDQGGDRQQLVGVLLARTPDSVRFEALSPFGQPLLIVSIHEGRLTAYNAGTNEALTGAATADAAARLLSLPFEPQDLVGVLAGRVPPPGDLRVAEILAPDEQGPSVDLIGALHRKRIWMNFETGVIRQVEIVGGRYEARVTYRLDGADRPSGFDLAAAQSYLTATVRYREPVFGAGIEGDRFRFTIPESAKIQQLR